MISTLKKNHNYAYKRNLIFFSPKVNNFIILLLSLNKPLKNLKLNISSFSYKPLSNLNSLNFFSINLKCYNYKYNFVSNSKCLISVSSKQIVKKLLSSNSSSKNDSFNLNYKSLKFIKTSIYFLIKLILNLKPLNSFFFISLVGKNFSFFFNLKFLINYFFSIFSSKGIFDIFYIWYPKLSKSNLIKKKKSIKKRLKKSNLYSFKNY